LYFDRLCVVNNHSAITGGHSQPQGHQGYCRDIGYLYPNSEFTLYDTGHPDFVSDTSGIAAGSFVTGSLITTIQHDGQIYDDAYFAAHFDVTVSAPSIATVGGGGNVVSNASNIVSLNDLSSVSQKVSDDSNFVGSAVGNNAEGLSETSEVTDAPSVTQVTGNLEIDESTLNDIFDSVSASLVTTVSNVSEFENYNDLENVYVVSGANFRVPSDLNSQVSGPVTFIVQNGNILIEQNIEYDDNIAFIVQNGNINIESDVTEIKGTYIAFEGNGASTGNIVSLPSQDQLVVHGSLYGNLDILIQNRSYISENNNGGFDVGTIVSFGSSLFQKPAPLVGEFIDQYIESTRTAE
ncbi:hypothetical protein MK079_04920, partial [Candidatus Gracilibacteria bacterium]|nr:hypothetical protein [Candidatus Gracilibacteria bacterium]